MLTNILKILLILVLTAILVVIGLYAYFLLNYSVTLYDLFEQLNNL